MELKDTINYIQEKFINLEDFTTDYKQRLQSFAMSGDKKAGILLKKQLKIIIENKVKVKGYTIEKLLDIVYADRYGLKILQKYYEDPKVDEIRVNKEDNIRIVKRGIPFEIEEKLNSEEDIETIIKRMIMDDIGVSLNKSNPTIESVLRDGSS